MRYRKRIKIAPGLNINLSGSGVSATIGGRGASVNVGKKGAYLNTGVPGTGLYSRTKISNSRNQPVIKTNPPVKTKVNVKIDLDNEYKPFIKVYDQSGNNITNPTNINRIKRTSEYKEGLIEIYQKYFNQIVDETKEFTEIYKETLSPITEEDILKKINDLSPEKYLKKTFDIQSPTKSDIENILKKEAKEKYNSIFFWKNISPRKIYITENLSSRLENALVEWSRQKDKFIENENITEKKVNAEYLNEYISLKDTLVGNIEGRENIVLQNFETILNEIDIKPEFFVDFEYSEESKTFKIDLDLPEIEHLPIKTASILKSGKLSVKNKSEKTLREDYAKCITGLGLLISGIAFMSSAGVKKVEISSYSQRLNKSVGKIEDEYLYSIKVNREEFSKLNFKNINPILAFENFEVKMNMSNTFIFKRIEI